MFSFGGNGKNSKNKTFINKISVAVVVNIAGWNMSTHETAEQPV
jgi:hypothetical protein